MSERFKVHRAEEIAAQLGVSRSAVSRAFNPDSYLKPEKRTQILKKAKELGYQPNMAARAMASNRSHLIAVVLHALRQPWESQEVDVLISELQAIGFATLIYKIPSYEIQLDHISHLKAYNPDGIIVYTDNLPTADVTSLFGRARPIFPVFASADTDTPNPETESTASFDHILIDQRPGIRHAIRLLAGSGCKTVAWLGGPESTQSNRDRKKIVMQSAEKYGLSVTTHIQGDFTYERAHEEVRAHFRTHPMVDAIFAANDVSAFGAIDSLRYDFNRRVPEDVKVVGFDNIRQCNWQSYNLTTVGMDVDERVRSLIRLIRNRLKSPQAPAMFERIETKLIVRGTVE
jgi:DNA-binding LacI/PurR family transcriptional regulator